MVGFVSAAGNAVDLSHRLVDLVRQKILQSDVDAAGQNRDPWDEEQGGVNWLDNELGFLDQLREQPELGGPMDSEFEPLHTVEICRQLLERRGVAYMRQAIAFTEAGGTGTLGIFDLRATCDPVQIAAFLAALEA